MIESTYTKSRCNECLVSLQAMLKREEKSYGCSSSSSSDSDSDYSDVRRSLVDVYDEVFDLCQLSNRDTVAVAISYLDRFLAVQQQYCNVQLAAMTCFYLAVKLYEPTVIPPAMLVEVFQRTLDFDDCDEVEDVDDDASTNTVVTAESIESMEMTVLSALNWNMNPPTAMMFVRQVLCCLPDAHNLAAWKQVAQSQAQVYVDAVIKTNDSMSMKASTLAVAALFLAVEKLPVSRRAAVFKFLLQAVHKTSAQLQREVLTVSHFLKSLVSQEEVVATPTPVSTKRTTSYEETPYDRPAKKQRNVVEDDDSSFTSSPRSSLLFPTSVSVHA